MHYQCINCSFEFSNKSNRKKLFTGYLCRECGEPVIDDEKRARIMERLARQGKEASYDAINDLLKDNELLPKLQRNLSNNSDLVFIEAIYKLLKDTTVDIGSKAIAFSTIVILLAPISIYLPFMISIQKKALIIITKNLLAGKLDKYLSDDVNFDIKFESFQRNRKLVCNIILYYDNEVINDEYEQKGILQISHLHISDIDKLGYKICNNNLPVPHTLYVRHPYSRKELILASEYDDFLLKSIIEEETRIIASFGAKKIVVEKKTATSSNYKTSVDIKACKAAFKSGVDTSSIKLQTKIERSTTEYAGDNGYDFTVINEVIWALTEKSSVLDTMKSIRIKNDGRKRDFYDSIYTGDFFSAKARASLPSVGINVGFSSSCETYCEWSIDAEFYPRPHTINVEMINHIDAEIQKRRMTLVNNM